VWQGQTHLHDRQKQGLQITEKRSGEMIEQAVKQEVQMQFAAKSNGVWNSIQHQVKRAAIAQAMHECRNNQKAAAAALGINRGSLRAYIEQAFTKSEIKDMGIES
jgi:DNA-binding protein Fis